LKRLSSRNAPAKDVDTNGSPEAKKHQEFVQNVKARIGINQEKKPENKSNITLTDFFKTGWSKIFIASRRKTVIFYRLLAASPLYFP
jgi:hypothetical protein